MHSTQAPSCVLACKRGRPIVERAGDYRRRYTVERSLAWLGNYRRLLIRWERQLSVYRGFFAFDVMLQCLRLLISQGAHGQAGAGVERQKSRRPLGWPSWVGWT